MKPPMIHLTSKELQEHAETSVALFWLHSARQILVRGDQPAKLTPQAYTLARDELSRPIYRHATIDVQEVAIGAKFQALQRLQLNAEWADVADFFGVELAHLPTK